jgi:hypothetical protein
VALGTNYKKSMSFASRMPFVKLILYVPPEAEEKVRLALGEAGAGKVGKYDYCTFVTRGVGHYRPLAGTKPYKGRVDEIESVEEHRIETVCQEQDLPRILKAMRAAHPYEEIAYDIVPLLQDQYPVLTKK